MPNEIEFDQPPDWKPLEKTVEPLRCSEFMHMGRIGTLQLYKHRHTRRYLNIDSDTGYCFIKVDWGYRYAGIPSALAYVLGAELEVAWN